MANLGVLYLKGWGVPQDFVRFFKETPKCWVKLTGVYRMSTAPAFAESGERPVALVDGRHVPALLGECQGDG